jgi:replicative DNA helicase
MCAAGIHPWTGKDMPPQKVLMVDSENHPDQVLESWQDMIGRAKRLDRPVQRGMLILQEEWDNEINLNEASGRRWLIERTNAHQPKLICIGPLYNLSSRDLAETPTVHEVKTAINEARSICGSAVIMEHHAPHRGNGDKDRSVRPYGSSTFLKWPDFGYGLKPEDMEGYYELQKTRFPRVRSRYFPGWMRWGKPNTLEWPWMPVTDPEAEMMGFGSKKF